MQLYVVAGAARAFAVGSLVCAGLLGAPPGSAQMFGAPPINDCNEYVARAISQIDMVCSPSSGRWTPRAAEHMNWCRTASAQARANENEARRNALVAGCRRDAGTRIIGDCSAYAWRALAQIEIAVGLGQSAPSCRFTGARWSQDLNAHLNWCRTAPASARASEDRERRKAVATCASQPAAPPPPPPTAATPPPAAAATLSSEQQAILAAHNKYRDKHCVPPFAWSAALAASAQAWANGCPKDARGNFCHQNDCGTKTPHGENLSAGWREANGKPLLPGRTADSAVDAWYCEIQAYNFGAPALVGGTTSGCTPVNGHFTQVVWKGSQQLGCAQATCPINTSTGPKQGTFWVCKYSPAGNNPQALAQNVQRPCK